MALGPVEQALLWLAGLAGAGNIAWQVYLLRRRKLERLSQEVLYPWRRVEATTGSWPRESHKVSLQVPKSVLPAHVAAAVSWQHLELRHLPGIGSGMRFLRRRKKLAWRQWLRVEDQLDEYERVRVERREVIERLVTEAMRRAYPAFEAASGWTSDLPVATYIPDHIVYRVERTSYEEKRYPHVTNPSFNLQETHSGSETWYELRDRRGTLLKVSEESEADFDGFQELFAVWLQDPGVEETTRKLVAREKELDRGLETFRGSLQRVIDEITFGRGR